MHPVVQAQFHVKGGSRPAEWVDLTEVQWMQSDMPPQQCMLICQLVRQSIEIWWPGNNKYYRGTMTEYLPEQVGPGTAVNHATTHLVHMHQAYMHLAACQAREDQAPLSTLQTCIPSHPVPVSFAQRMPLGYILGDKASQYDTQQRRICCIVSALTWNPGQTVSASCL